MFYEGITFNNLCVTCCCRERCSRHVVYLNGILVWDRLKRGMISEFAGPTFVGG